MRAKLCTLLGEHLFTRVMKSGEIRSADLRSYPVTTAVWVRAVLAEDYGVAPERVECVAFEEPHVAEYQDPPNVERAPPGKDMTRRCSKARSMQPSSASARAIRGWCR